MTSRHMTDTVSRAGNNVSVHVAEQVQSKGYIRLIDAIDPMILNKTTERVVKAVEGENMFTEEQAGRVSSVVITYMAVENMKLTSTRLTSG